ncbi:MAG: hypothetical protein OEZ06_20635 [Myxococcales bacterium]|nr:hypothetical protein [Myxococcales bacterium]
MRGLSWLGVVALAAAMVAGCSADNSGTDGSRGNLTNGGGFGNATDGTSSDGTDPAAGGFGNSGGNTAGGDTGTTPVFTQPPVTVEASFIWIANSAQGTVSKLDTRTMTELGRYLTSPNGTGLPSRTSVSDSGDVAVANRGNATAQMPNPPDGGGVTKIYADVANCEDKNGNGTIETSTGAGDVLPWGQEECVAWYTPINHFSNRPVQWAPAPAPDAPADVWTAGATTCDFGGCSFDAFRLDGVTGAIKDTVSIAGLTGVDMITAGGIDPTMLGPAGLLIGLLPPSTLILNYGPYGGVADAGGNFWIFNSNTTHLIRIDAVTLQWRSWTTPMGNGYGITIDSQGRIFVCGTLGVSRFDPPTESWYSTWEAGATVDLGYNGCMTDGMGTLWVGGGSDQGQIGLFGISTESLQLVDQVNTDDQGNQMRVKGVSIDIDGNVWGVSSPGADMSGPGNLAWRFNPLTREVASYDGLEGAYSYSDMTGFGLQQAGFKEPPPLE